FVGVNNRLTLVSSLGQVVLIVALAALGAIALASLAKTPRIGAPLAAAVLVINCGLLVRKEIQNQDPWIAAGREQDKIFAAVDAGLPNPPPGSVVVTFGHPTYIEGVPVFLDFDLGFALQLRHSEAMAR